MSELIEVKNLKKYYPIKSGFLNRNLGNVKAVDGVNFSIKRGKTLGLVGESGCGKSTVGRVMVGLNPSTEGDVIFDGESMITASPDRKREMRKRMQMVFQDPFSSLDPRMNVYDLISEGMVAYNMVKSRDELEEKVNDLMSLCGLFPDQAYRYAHQFSGGQRQRICIARALATHPDFIVLDEAVSALDVSIQAQIINLLKDLQDEMKLTYLFVSHDLNIVRFISDEVAVMYLGEIVEYGTRQQIFDNPLHPYTVALLSASPAFTRAEKANKKRIILEGDLPSPYDMPQGCRFATRCPYCVDKCIQIKPDFLDRGDGHFCMCHRADLFK